MKGNIPLQRLPGRGTATAAEIYSAVGQALSWWEASEDALLDLFSTLCRNLEPTAFGAYVKAPRSVRSSMLSLAMLNHAARITSEETIKVQEILRQLDKLAPIRNQIAHGFVQHLTISVGGATITSEEQFQDTSTLPSPSQNSETIVEGNYLLPSLNEQGLLERSVRFHHDASSIRSFEKEVCDARWCLISITMDIMNRQQYAELAAGPDAIMHLRDAVDLAWGRIPVSKAVSIMRSFDERRAARKRGTSSQ